MLPTLCYLSLSLSRTHKHTKLQTFNRVAVGLSLLLTYDAAVANLFARGWYGMTRLLMQRWIHGLGIVCRQSNSSFVQINSN